MSIASTPVEIDYPESDGKPMGESDLHIQWIIRLRDMLKWRYRDRRTYVAADLLVYYEEGQPRKFIVPDVFVVQGCDPGLRRVYKVWEEPSPPQVVFEVTSRSTKREDTNTKPHVFDAIGVREYFLYDPTNDYLNPPLQGFRRSDAGRGFLTIEPDAGGWLASEVLDLKLRLEQGRLMLYDSATGAPLLTEGEAERAARQAEQKARQAEQRARQAEQQARQAAEAELERLRARLRSLGLDE